MRLFKIVPGSQAAGLLVRKQDVAFGLHALAIHHDVDLVAHLDRDGAVRLHELVDWNKPFGLVSEVDDDVGLVALDDAALQ